MALALLRSLKQAEYTAETIGHYALAVDDYCHFTSPIRRYPDLTVHRLIDAILLGGRRRKTKGEFDWQRLGQHCSATERRAAAAERELTKVKLLTFVAGKVGETFDAVITGVEPFGLFCRLQPIPVEGLIHVTALDPADYFDYDRSALSLVGRRSGKRFRLGDAICVEVARVDVDRRELDLRPAPPQTSARRKRKVRTTSAKSSKPAKGKPAGKKRPLERKRTGRKTSRRKRRKSSA